MARIFALVLCLLPTLAQAQSFHYLLEFTPWNYADSESEVVSWDYLKTKGLGLLLAVTNEDDSVTQTLVLTDKDGAIAESYLLEGLENFDSSLEYQGNFLYYNYRSKPTFTLTTQSWRHFRYRVSNGLTRRLDQNAALSGQSLVNLKLDDTGFRFTSLDFNANAQLSGVQTTSGVWSYKVDKDPFDNFPLVSMNQDSELVWSFGGGDTLLITRLDRNGGKTWGRQLPASEYANLLSYDTPKFYRVAGWLLSDGTSILALRITDEGTNNSAVFLMRVDASGGTLWHHRISPTMDAPFIFTPAIVNWGPANAGRVYYYTNSYSQVGVLNPGTLQARQYTGIDTVNSLIRYQPFLFDDGTLGVTRLSYQLNTTPTILTQYYTYFNVAFWPFSQGDWIYYDYPNSEVTPAILGELIYSQFQNDLSVMIAESPAKMRTAGFVSNKVIVDGGALFVTTNAGISLQDSNHSLTTATVNIIVSAATPLDPPDAGVTSAPLDNATFPVVDINDDDLRRTYGLDPAGDWVSTFFGYPWFTYTLRQGDNLVDWSNSVRATPYGFQESYNEFEDFPFFEQLNVSE